MKKSLFFISLFIITLSLILPASLLAAELRTEPNAYVSSSESITGNIYLAGKTVNSAGNVGGDVVATGGTIAITGSTSKEVIAAGGNVSILGNVGESVRVAGGNIIINGKVLGDISAVGGQINISSPEIAGDVLVAGGSVFIDAPINGNVNVIAGKVALGSHAVINGNFTYTSGEPAEIDSGAVIKGQTQFNQKESHQGKGVVASFITLWILAKFLMLLVMGLLLGLIFKRFSAAATTRAIGSFWRYVGIGFVTLVILPVAAMLLLITVIGIPLAILCIFSFVAFVIVSSALMPIILGSILYKWMTKGMNYEITWKTILLGAVAVLILGIIPFIGWLVLLAFFLLSTGVLVSLKYGQLKEWM